MATRESKTIREWLESITDPELRNIALRNLRDGRGDYKTSTLSRSISRAFSWSDSPEGYKFWNRIANKAANGEISTSDFRRFDY